MANLREWKFSEAQRWVDTAKRNREPRRCGLNGARWPTAGRDGRHFDAASPGTRVTTSTAYTAFMIAGSIDDIVLSALLAVALAACIVYLMGRRTGVRLYRQGGLSIAFACYAVFALVCWGVVPVSAFSYIARRAGGLRLVSGATIGPGDVSTALESATVGELPDEEFLALLESRVSAVTIGARGNSALSLVAEYASSGRLPTRYADLYAKWLVDTWPAWHLPTPDQLDEVPHSVLVSSAVSPARREALVDLMIGAIGTPGQVICSGWCETLDTLFLSGKLDRARMETYLAALPRSSIELATADGKFWRSDVAVCSATGMGERSTRTSMSRLPWSGRIVLVGGTGMAVNAMEVSLPSWEDAAALGMVRMPDTAGRYRVEADVEATLTRDQLREWFTLNPLQRPADLRIEDLPDLRVKRRIGLEIDVEERRAEPIDLARDAALADQVRTAITFAEHVARVEAGPGRLTVIPMNIRSPRVSLAMSVFLEAEGQEIPAGCFLVRAGQTLSVTARASLARVPTGDVRLIFRPEPEFARFARDMGPVYAGPPIILSPRVSISR